MFSWTISLGDIVMVFIVLVGLILNWAGIQARLKAIETWIRDHRARHEKLETTFDELRIRSERHFAKSAHKE